MATAPSPNDLTRQQLDELDALLQRMLSVPLSPVDTPMPAGSLPAPLPPSAPGWRADAPAPAGVSAPHIHLPEPPSSVSLAAPAPPIAPVAKTPGASAPAPPTSPQPPQTPGAYAPGSPGVPKGADAPRAPKPAPPVAKTPAAYAAPGSPVVSKTADAPRAPAPAAPPVPLQFLPFVLLNVFFDFVCGLFGPPGRLLRSGFFKQLYGLAGLALLAYTAAHLAQAKGWLSLPVQLPWPPSLR